MDSALNLMLDAVRRLQGSKRLEPVLTGLAQAGQALLGSQAVAILYAAPAQEEWLLGQLEIGGRNCALRLPTALLDGGPRAFDDAQLQGRPEELGSGQILQPFHNLEKETLGAFAFLGTHGELTSDQVKFCRLLGELAALAVRQRLEDKQRQHLEHEMKMAWQVKRQFLPRAHLKMGLDVCGWLLPEGRTGGDIYDYWPTPRGELAFLVADASGHGLGPSLMVTQARAYFRALLDRGADLAEVAQQVNGLLGEDLHDDRFVTAFVGRLATKTGTVQYVNAGLGQFFRVGEDQTVTAFGPTAPPLGILPEFEARIGELVLAPGEKLVVLSDGLSDWRNVQGEAFGDERVARALGRHSGSDCRELMRRLHEEVLEFAAGADQTDDVTALAVARKDKTDEKPD